MWKGANSKLSRALSLIGETMGARTKALVADFQELSVEGYPAGFLRKVAHAGKSGQRFLTTE